MTFALISATRFEFSYDKNEQVPLRTLNDDLKRNVSPTTNNQELYQPSNTIKLMQIIQIFITLKNGTFLFIAWYEI
jgi:hypothetical protein